PGEVLVTGPAVVVAVVLVADVERRVGEGEVGAPGRQLGQPGDTVSRDYLVAGHAGGLARDVRVTPYLATKRRAREGPAAPPRRAGVSVETGTAGCAGSAGGAEKGKEGCPPRE